MVLELPSLALPGLDKINKKKSLVDDWDWFSPKQSLGGNVNDFIETGWVGDFHLDKVLSVALESGASDIHITCGHPVAFTVNGDIEFRDEFVIPDTGVMFELVETMMTHVQYGDFIKDYELGFAYEIRKGPYSGSRLRAKAGKSLGSEYLVFRTINDEIPSTESLEIEAELKDWFTVRTGLALICGSTGTGKSTTLASILRDIQLKRAVKIITIENPIEYEYPEDGRALMVQREVGVDCVSFYDALTGAMRESPDILLLGEVRDTEEVSELLRAAETGHLAVSTMRTNSVATTINRIQSLFSGNERDRILSTLSDTLVGIGNQILVKAKDGKGRFACRELLTIDSETRKMVAKGDSAAIRDYLITKKKTMEYSLVRAYLAGKCTKKEARNQATRKADFDSALADLRHPKRDLSAYTIDVK